MGSVPNYPRRGGGYNFHRAGQQDWRFLAATWPYGYNAWDPCHFIFSSASWQNEFPFACQDELVFPFLQASQTQSSWSVLSDVWYLYLLIFVMCHSLLEDLPMPTLGRANSKDNPTVLELLNIPLHGPFSDSYFFCEFRNGDERVLLHQCNYFPRRFPRHFPRHFWRNINQFHLIHRFAVHCDDE